MRRESEYFDLPANQRTNKTGLGALPGTRLVLVGECQVTTIKTKNSGNWLFFFRSQSAVIIDDLDSCPTNSELKDEFPNRPVLRNVGGKVEGQQSRGKKKGFVTRPGKASSSWE